MKYNKSEIMKAAHSHRKAHCLDMSAALRAAWLEAKISLTEKSLLWINLADRFTAADWRMSERLNKEHSRLYSALRAIIPAPAKKVMGILEAEERRERVAAESDAKRDAGTAHWVRSLSTAEFAKIFCGAVVA